MPTELQITVQETAILTRLADYAHTLPAGGGLNVNSGQLRDQAITELTGLPPSPIHDTPIEDSHLDDRYVLIG